MEPELTQILKPLTTEVKRGVPCQYIPLYPYIMLLGNTYMELFWIQSLAGLNFIKAV